MRNLGGRSGQSSWNGCVGIWRARAAKARGGYQRSPTAGTSGAQVEAQLDDCAAACMAHWKASAEQMSKQSCERTCLPGVEVDDARMLRQITADA